MSIPNFRFSCVFGGQPDGYSPMPPVGDYSPFLNFWRLYFLPLSTRLPLRWKIRYCWSSSPVFLKALRSVFFCFLLIGQTSLSVSIIAHPRGFVNPLVQLPPNNIYSGYLRSFSVRRLPHLPRCDRSKWVLREKDHLG